MTLAEMPLTGVRVLDLTSLLPGPFASQILADLGATVVKVERPGGDPMRQIGYGAFAATNRGKHSVELDLKAPVDRQVVFDLLEHADVLLENNRPGVMERLGLGFEALREAYPSLIYVSISGWGQDGPAASEPGHNGNYLARAGATYLTGSPEMPPSEAVPVATADLGGALFTVIGVLSALRSEPRCAAHLDVSLFASGLALMAPRFAEYVEKGSPGRDELLRRPAHGVFAAGDGRYLTIAAVEDHFWVSLCRALDLPGLAERPDLIRYEDRLAHADEIDQLIGDAFSRGTRDEWVETLRSFDVPVAPVLAPDEVPQDPQVRHLGLYQSWPDIRSFVPVTGLVTREDQWLPDLGADGQDIRDHGWPGPIGREGASRA